MADEMTPQAGTTPEAQAAPEKQQTPPAVQAAAEDVGALPEWAQKAITDLRKESASQRKARADAEKVAQAAAETAAKEQGKWKELYEGAEPKAKRADTLEAFIGELVASELEAVPEKLKALVPEFDDPLKTLQWVRSAKAAGVLATPVTPSTDAREAQKTGKPGMSEDQRKRLADAYGVLPQFIPQ